MQRRSGAMVKKKQHFKKEEIPGAIEGQTGPGGVENQADGQREADVVKCCLLMYVGVWRSFPPRSWKAAKWIEKWKLEHTHTTTSAV